MFILTIVNLSIRYGKKENNFINNEFYSLINTFYRNQTDNRVLKLHKQFHKIVISLISFIILL